LNICGVSEISSWANEVLDDVEVNKVISNIVDDVTEYATCAIWDLRYSSVGSSKGCKISYFSLHWAFLYDVSSK
jgi:hypothetical protein